MALKPISLLNSKDTLEIVSVNAKLTRDLIKNHYKKFIQNRGTWELNFF